MVHAPSGGVRPVRVFIARSVTEAELAVVFLGDRGIPARVENPLTQMTLSPIEGAIDGADGIPVVVPSDRAVAAKEALEDFTVPAGSGTDDGEDEAGADESE
jgi:hypothetical protein